MANGFYPVINGTTRKGIANYAVIGSITRKITKMYAVVNGVTRLIWSNVIAPLYTGIVYCADDDVSYSIRTGNSLGSSINIHTTGSDTMCSTSVDGKYMCVYTYTSSRMKLIVYQYDKTTSTYSQYGESIIVGGAASNSTPPTDTIAYSLGYKFDEPKVIKITDDGEYIGFVVHGKESGASSTEYNYIIGLLLFKNNGSGFEFEKLVPLMSEGVYQLVSVHADADRNLNNIIICCDRRRTSSSADRDVKNLIFFKTSSDYLYSSGSQISSFPYLNSSEFETGQSNCGYYSYSRNVCITEDGDYAIVSDLRNYENQYEDCYKYKILYLNNGSYTEIGSLDNIGLGSSYQKRWLSKIIKSYDGKNLYISESQNRSDSDAHNIYSYSINGSTITYVTSYEVNPDVESSGSNGYGSTYYTCYLRKLLCEISGNYVLETDKISEYSVSFSPNGNSVSGTTVSYRISLGQLSKNVNGGITSLTDISEISTNNTEEINAYIVGKD